MRIGNVFEAASKNDQDGVKYFIEGRNISTTGTNPVGQTVAHIAASNGNLLLLKYLLERDPSLIFVKDRWDQTVLHLAAEKGALDVVEYLLENCHADKFQYSNLLTSNNILHIAAEAGHLPVVKYLIEKEKMDPEEKNGEGRPCFFLAANSNHLRIIEYLAERNTANLKTLDNEDRNILFMCASSFNGSPMIPKYLLDHKNITIDVDWRDNQGLTVTNYACRFSHLDLIKYFVDEKHADVNVADNLRRTPLYHASYINNVELVEYLVDRGADPKIKDVFGRMAANVTKNTAIAKCIQLQSKKQRARRSFLVPSPTNTIPLHERLFPLPGSIVIGGGGSHHRASVAPFVFVDTTLHNERSTLLRPSDKYGGGGGNFSSLVLILLSNCLRGYTTATGTQRSSVEAIPVLTPTSSIQNNIDPLAVDIVSHQLKYYYENRSPYRRRYF